MRTIYEKKKKRKEEVEYESIEKWPREENLRSCKWRSNWQRVKLDDFTRFLWFIPRKARDVSYPLSPSDLCFTFVRPQLVF